jgi:hypothetical protein
MDPQREWGKDSALTEDSPSLNAYTSTLRLIKMLIVKKILDIVIREISQVQKDKYHMFSLILGS